jgi:hypothetical protein
LNACCGMILKHRLRSCNGKRGRKNEGFAHA